MALATFQSTNFQVQYESTDYTQDELLILQPLAQALPNECEPDYATLCGWFGIPVGEGFGPGNRTVVTLTKAVRGASNTGYSSNNSQMAVNPNLGGSADSVQSFFCCRDDRNPHEVHPRKLGSLKQWRRRTLSSGRGDPSSDVGPGHKR